MDINKLAVLVTFSFIAVACVPPTTQNEVPNNKLLLDTVETRGDYQKLPKAEEHARLYEIISKDIDNRTKYFSGSDYIRNYLYPYPEDCIFCSVPDLSKDGITSSSTNLIEQGVDEADYIKTKDGFIYFVSDNIFNIFQHQDDDQPEELATLTLVSDLAPEDGNTAVDDYNYLYNANAKFYLNDQTAIVERHYSYFVPFISARRASNDISARGLAIPDIKDQGSYLFKVDLDQKSAPAISHQARIDNTKIISSRRIDDTIFYYLSGGFNHTLLDAVYQNLDDYLAGIDGLEAIYKSDTLRPLYAQLLASRFAIEIENLKQSYKDDPEKAYNINYTYLDDEDNSQTVTIDNCLFNPQLDTKAWYSRYSAIIAVDANNLELKNHLCFEGDGYYSGARNFYMSQEGLYLFKEFSVDTQQGQKLVQQPAIRASRIAFSSDDATLTYQGFGEVLGYLPRNGNSHFYMSEHNKHLRLFTNAAKSNESPYNMLHILRVDDAALSHVAQLPSAENPEPIGKPDEFAYGARFINSQAYLITGVRQFNQDPLIRFDLSEPAAPRISGELDVLSFAQYLHPIGDELLLGIGRNRNDVDIRLFNIAQDTPSLIDSLRIENSFMNLHNEHKGICIQSDNGNSVFKSAFMTHLRNGSSAQWLQLQTNKTLPLAGLAAEGFALPEGFTRYYVNRCLYIDDSFYIFDSKKIRKMN